MDCMNKNVLDGRKGPLCFEKTNGDYKYLNMDCGVYMKNEKTVECAGRDKGNDCQGKERGLDIKALEQGVELQREGDRGDQRGNPNDVLRSMLLAIKPPDGRPESACGSLPRVPSKSPSVFSDRLSSGDFDYDEKEMDNGEDEVFISGTNKVTDDLLQQIDTLLQFDRGGEQSGSLNCYKQNQEPYSKVQQAQHEWGFLDDSGLSSDWSPLSTIDSGDSSATSSKSCHSDNLAQLSPAHRNRKGSPAHLTKRVDQATAQSRVFNSSNREVGAGYSQSELSAIRKFLTLTSKYFDEVEGKALRELNPLQELSMIPDIKCMIESQNREVKNQREMIQGFICQLGDLLTEILNLKEEQTAVRTKQTKALALLKKQLDHHKSSVSQTYNDIRDQVNTLYEKMNCSQLTNEPTSPAPPPKSKSSKSTPSFSSKPSRTTKSNLPPHISPTSPTSRNNNNNNYGHIIWKISDVMRKITRIKSGLLDGTLVSDPFQTGEYQYNMNAWVYLNGRGKMIGKCVSVYACILVGEYDAILTWPVRPTYKFTLIDQRGDVGKRQDHVRYRRVMDIADGGESVISQHGGIPRPTDGSKALIVGLDDFIAHDQLMKNRYLVDDVLYLKVEAEIN